MLGSPRCMPSPDSTNCKSSSRICTPETRNCAPAAKRTDYSPVRGRPGQGGLAQSPVTTPRLVDRPWRAVKADVHVLPPAVQPCRSRQTLPADTRRRVSALIARSHHACSAPNITSIFSKPQLPVVQQALTREVSEPPRPLKLPKVPKPDELRPGLQLEIDGHSFEITSPLGKGSFGVVWGAVTRTHGEVAIKKILCWSKASLQDAEFEGELLMKLGSSPGTQKALSRLPKLIAQETEVIGDEQDDTWRVWIAMTKLPGEQLSTFLEEHETTDLREACGFAHELLDQLVSTFDHVANVAFHRDATPRNILVDFEHGFPRFNLIDFGLAVDATHWHQGVTSTQQVSIAGDGRYWPVSSWYTFEYGRDELVQVPGLNEEYKTRLDIHSLGITAIQVIAEMCPSVHAVEGDDQVSAKLKQLLLVWSRYWRDATHFWISIFQTFQEHGDFESLKVAYMRAGVHETIRKDLFALRAAIREARHACESAPEEASLAPVVSLMNVLLIMISNGEKSDPPPTWKLIRSRISGEQPEMPSEKVYKTPREPSPQSTMLPSTPSSSPVSLLSERTPERTLTSERTPSSRSSLLSPSRIPPNDGRSGQESFP